MAEALSPGSSSKRVSTTASETSGSSSPPSQSTGRVASSKQTAKRKSRTTNACELCKRRKTKCSGPPIPCEACAKSTTGCLFDEKPEPRHKINRSSELQDPQQYLLNGMFQILKHGSEEPLAEFITLLRQDYVPQAVAGSLRRNLELLQQRGVLANTRIEQKDLMALAVRTFNTQRASGTTQNTTSHIDHTLTTSPDTLTWNDEALCEDNGLSSIGLSSTSVNNSQVQVGVHSAITNDTAPWSIINEQQLWPYLTSEPNSDLPTALSYSPSQCFPIFDYPQVTTATSNAGLLSWQPLSVYANDVAIDDSDDPNVVDNFGATRGSGHNHPSH